MSTHGQAPEPKAPVRHPELGHVGLTLHDSSDVGYHKALTNGQIQMIALGGAIGLGLFLGAGSRLAKAGPSLILSYALTGVVAFFLAVTAPQAGAGRRPPTERRRGEEVNIR